MQARRCLLGLAGVAAAGHRTQLGAIAREFAAGDAFAGANMLDAFDAHDGHALTKGRAGAAILPTPLALADGPAAMDGAEFLLCLVLGYEVVIRPVTALLDLLLERA